MPAETKFIYTTINKEFWAEAPALRDIRIYQEVWAFLVTCGIRWDHGYNTYNVYNDSSAYHVIRPAPKQKEGM